MKAKLLALCVLVAASRVAAAEGDGDTEALRAADKAWSAAFAARDVNASAAAVAPAGRLLAPNQPAAATPAAVREELKGIFGIPDMKIGWVADLASVAKSGELGYTSGRYSMSWKGSDGKIATDRGNYVTVWRKQHGTWKVLLDTFASTEPRTAD